MTLSPNILQLYSQQTNYTIFGISWIPNSARVLSVGMAARGTGIISVWNFDDQKLVEQSRHEKQSALKCVTFGASLAPSRTFGTGDHDGNLFTFDIENLQKPQFHVKAHQSMIHCVDGIGGRNFTQIGAPEIASGSSDGFVKLWDVRQPQPVLEFTSSVDSETRTQIDRDKMLVSKPEAWCVALGGASSTSDRYLLAGFDSGDIKAIDLRMMKVCWEHHLPNGIVSMEFDRQDTKLNKLTVGTLEGHTYCFDLVNGFEKASIVDQKFFGDSSTIWQVRHSPFNRDVFAVTGGSKIGIAKYDYPKERSIEDKTIAGKLEMKTDAVVSTQTCQSMCWSREKNGLLAWGSMDQTVNVGYVTNMKSLE
ncbi:G-beta repeat-containing protein [Hexamita inflata]|uniref:G-beta repeat-containing protein n=1 Tax=Hexamita inflata TaxID=28002 RepID=A0AA86RQ59_9EUKA|nr:G-beta repeat-containing protein [Hexamita inflata]CAI9976067.1 G-beta repeat-containing protein [Hexamita inflata]